MNKNDFKCRLKASVSVIVRRCGGREFHANTGPDSRVAEATLAELGSRSCSAFKVVCCIRRSQVSGSTSVDYLYTVNQPTRYCGGRPRWIRCINRQSFNLILLATGNQWSCFSADVTYSIMNQKTDFDALALSWTPSPHQRPAVTSTFDL